MVTTRSAPAPTSRRSPPRPRTRSSPTAPRSSGPRDRAREPHRSLGPLDRATIERPEGPMGFTRLTPTKPAIAAISGWCLAGGLELALWCDLRIATETARLGFPERRWGVPLIDGGTQRLPRIVGMGRALELILTGRPVEAEEAHRIGLVNEIV